MRALGVENACFTKSWSDIVLVGVAADNENKTGGVESGLH